MTFFTFTFIIYRYSTIDLNYFFSSNLLLHSHDAYFVNILYSFVPEIMFNTLSFESTLLDQSLRVLQLPTHLSDLNVNG